MYQKEQKPKTITNCPTCRISLKRENTYQLRGNRIEKIGEHLYCPNDGCNYEVDL